MDLHEFEPRPTTTLMWVWDGVSLDRLTVIADRFWTPSGYVFDVDNGGNVTVYTDSTRTTLVTQLPTGGAVDSSGGVLTPAQLAAGWKPVERT